MIVFSFKFFKSILTLIVLQKNLSNMTLERERDCLGTNSKEQEIKSNHYTATVDVYKDQSMHVDGMTK